MTSQNLRAIARSMHPELTSRIIGALGVRAEGGDLWNSMIIAGAGQSDLVLCLLKMETPRAKRAVERLIGKPVTVCPPMLRRARSPLPVRICREGDERRIRLVRSNPHPTATTARDRFRHFRPGRSIAEVLARGATRRDLRGALRRGAVVLFRP